MDTFCVRQMHECRKKVSHKSKYDCFGSWSRVRCLSPILVSLFSLLFFRVLRAMIPCNLRECVRICRTLQRNRKVNALAKHQSPNNGVTIIGNCDPTIETAYK